MEEKIGERIKSVFDASQIKLKDFAEELGVARQNIYRIFEKDSIDSDLLMKICQVLNHNFFQYFESPNLNRRDSRDTSGNKELDDVQKELESYKNELRLAKKEIDYLKKIIELMEERTKLLLSQKV